MKFGITQETNLSVDKVNSVNELSSAMKDNFRSLSYGKDVNQILIGVICVKPEFDFFYKVRKLKYSTEESFENDLGEIIKVTNSVSYDIKLDYEFCDQQSDIQETIAKAIFDSLSTLDNLPKKVKDFDTERFKSDLKSFFKERNLI